MRRAYRFVTCDVFTATRFADNPLAVLPDARGLSDAHMQAIAREFNFSETTFVLAAIVAIERDATDIVFEEGVGPVPVYFERAGDTVTAVR